MNRDPAPPKRVNVPSRTRRIFLRDLARLGGGLAGLGLLASCAPTPAPTGPARVYRVGVLSNAVETPFPEFTAFWDRLRELGYVEGKNLAREQRAEGGQAPEPWVDLVAELARLPVDVIVVTSGPVSQVGIAATTSVPVVLMRTSDPVAFDGQVASLARPGGNVTGLAGARGEELDLKRLELLLEAVPGIARIGVLGTTPDFASDFWRAASARFGVAFVSLHEAGGPIDVEAAFARARAERADGLLVRSGGTVPAAPLIGRLAARDGLPGAAQNRGFVTAGGLLVYEPRQSEVERRAAEYVDRILRGARPADLPMELPTRYDLVVNMRTARTLGLTLSSTFVDQVTEMIE